MTTSVRLAAPEGVIGGEATPMAGTQVGDWRWPLLGYALVFLALAARLLPQFASAVPMNPNIDDAHVLPWVLAWVAHALAVEPGRLFEANISYPAPLQLTGTDPLFASQLLFAPLFAATRNPVLSANLVVLLSYPLAALAMERLLRRFAISAGIAWVAGLVFALGVLRVPFNLNELAYPNLVLPWIALALTRLRDEPSLRRTAALLLAFTVGIFAGLYAAVLVGLLAAIWGLFELVRRGSGRARFVAYAIGTAVLAGSALLLAIKPYLENAPSRSNTVVAAAFALTFASPKLAATSALFLLGLYPQSVRLDPRGPAEVCVLIAAGLLAVVAWAARARPATATQLVPRAVTLWLVFGTLAWGYPWPLADLVVASPLVSFRYLYRFVVPADLGLVILLAVSLETLRVRGGIHAGRFAALAVLLLVLWSRGVPFALSPMHRVAALEPGARAVYDQVAAIVADEGGGPLLELPIHGQLAGVDDSPTTLEPDAMLASTLHWWPTPAAHLSYHPPHRAFFMNTVALLTTRRAQEDLVDLTHVRWLLVRPEAQWLPGGRAALMKALAAWPEVGRVWTLPAGWSLLRLDRKPQHERWFENVRAGGARGLSVLGSPLAPIPDERAKATVRIESAPPQGAAGQNVVAVVSVRNDGDLPWAAVPTPLAPLTLDGRWTTPVTHDGTVVLVERWRKLDASGAPAEAEASEHERFLRRDVDPGEELRQMVTLSLPPEPGLYELELHVKQVEGASFQAAGNAPERRRVTVGAAPADGH